MGLTKSGDIICRCRHSKCEICKYYIKDYKCWYLNYINAMIWNGGDYHKCDKFKSILKNQLNSHYIFPDFEDRNRFPEKKFGGTYRFNSKGEIIGKL